jgi:hypothetical protein
MASGDGQFHEGAVDPVGLEQAAAALRVGVPHRDPDVGEHRVRPAHRRRGVVGEADPALRSACPLQQPGAGASSGGLAMSSAKPRPTAAWTREVSTLLPSPTQASVRSRMSPWRSSTVSRSAMIWQGWEWSVRPFTTGTVACSASSSSFAWLSARIMIAST